MRFGTFSLFAAALSVSASIGPALAQSTIPVSVSTDGEQATFPICAGSNRVTCIVDGDTIWYRGTKIRIADIDTPEVSRPACPREAAIGRRATERMQALLNAGAFTLAPGSDGRDADRFGRKLRVVMRGGASLGETLIAEGLAESWGGPRIAWC